MAVKIRLTRIGEKKVPMYRIVVADANAPRNGRSIDEIGSYNPNTDPATVTVDAEAAKKWIANGAQPTTVVKKLFKQAGIK
ncbi:MAG: 30S ribosomal protein S16 [Lachnospiraceae bacterium]|nr:30S ribosomal protein S16 [Lachnospiraceae bacterium]